MTPKVRELWHVKVITMLEERQNETYPAEVVAERLIGAQEFWMVRPLNSAKPLSVWLSSEWFVSRVVVEGQPAESPRNKEMREAEERGECICKLDIDQHDHVPNYSWRGACSYCGCKNPPEDEQ